jgi:glyoxylase-like metal-dependent hydrolase (beta-lactamase superfamily II)
LAIGGIVMLAGSRTPTSTRRHLAFAALATIALAGCATAPARTPLQLDVFTAPEGGYGVTSAIIYGETEAIIVDAQFRNSDAAALADRVDALNRRVTAIIVTHPDADHYIGLDLLHRHFPEARLYMSGPAIPAFRADVAERLPEFARSPAAHQAPQSEPDPEPLPGNALMVDGQRVELIADLQGDYGPAPHNSVVWVPSLRALIASDMAFDGVHVWSDKSTFAGRAAWIAALSRLEAMNPAIVVPGHKRDAAAPNAPSVLTATREYLEAFERERAANADAAALQAATQRLYPEHRYPIFLTYSARNAYAAQAEAEHEG